MNTRAVFALATATCGLALTQCSPDATDAGPEPLVATPPVEIHGSKGDQPLFRFVLLANGLKPTFQTDEVDVCVATGAAAKNSSDGAGYAGPLGKENGGTLDVPGVTYFFGADEVKAGDTTLFLRIQKTNTDCAVGDHQIRVIKDPPDKVQEGDNTYIVYGSFATPGALVGRIVYDAIPSADGATIQIFNGVSEPIDVQYEEDQNGTVSSLANDVATGDTQARLLKHETPTQFTFSTNGGTKVAVTNTISYEKNKTYSFYVYKDDSDKLAAFGCENHQKRASSGGITNACNFK